MFVIDSSKSTREKQGNHKKTLLNSDRELLGEAAVKT